MTQHITSDENDKYTIQHVLIVDADNYFGYQLGDVIDLVTGDVIVGDYCVYPKQEPRRFVVTEYYEPPAVMVKRKVVFKEVDEKIKFYQRLNRKSWER